MEKMVLRSILFVLVLWFAGVQMAVGAELRCDRCTESDYVAKATRAGFGVQYVYDFYNGQARKYFVEREPNELGKYDYFADSIPVEADFELAVLEYSDYYHRTGGTLASWFDLDADDEIGDMTAFDAAGPGAGRTRLQSWILGAGVMSLHNALPGLGAATHSLLGAVLNIVKSNPIATHITIVFSDGSKIEVTLDAINNAVAVVENSATDSAGNPIPVTAAGAVGIQFDYTHDPAAAQPILDWLLVRGAKVVDGRNRGPGTVTVGGKITCVPDGNGGVTCTII